MKRQVKKVNTCTVLAMLVLFAGCDFAPRPVNFERTVIETEAEMYQLSLDAAMGGVIAERIAEGCPGYLMDTAARQAHIEQVQEATARFERDHPEAYARFVERYNLDGENPRLGPGILSDVVGRVLTYFTVRGFPVTEDGLCRAGRAEVRQNTLAGSFLIDVREETPFEVPFFPETSEADP